MIYVDVVPKLSLEVRKVPHNELLAVDIENYIFNFMSSDTGAALGFGAFARSEEIAADHICELLGKMLAEVRMRYPKIKP